MRALPGRRSVAVVGALTAVLTTVVGAGTAQAATPGYVALGDSYSAGSGVPPLAPDAPLICARSAANYPHLVAAVDGYQLTDVTCGGATTSDMTTAQHRGVPPQFDALTSTTSVVTIGIGGNDNGFFGHVLEKCSLVGLAGEVGVSHGAPCEKLFGDSLASDISSDAGAIGAALREIHSRSPHANVFLVGYPDVVPQSGGCYPAMPIANGDIAFLNRLETQLNSMLRTEAEQNGVSFVDTYTPTIGHDACQAPGVRWIEPLIGANGAVAVHPNAAGEAAEARAVESAIKTASAA
ncbi:MAG TPA: SGNH/GDSL hydrolase family protein [Pseudonocardiaceae bacterium]